MRVAVDHASQASRAVYGSVSGSAGVGRSYRGGNLAFSALYDLHDSCAHSPDAVDPAGVWTRRASARRHNHRPRALTPIAVNADDQIVGDVDDNSGNLHAALWNGSWQMLGQLSSTDGATRTRSVRAGGSWATISAGHRPCTASTGTAAVPPRGRPVQRSRRLGGRHGAGRRRHGGRPRRCSPPCPRPTWAPQGSSTTPEPRCLVGQTDLGAQPGGTTVGGITPDGTRMLGYIGDRQRDDLLAVVLIEAIRSGHRAQHHAADERCAWAPRESSSAP